ncbi:hypothetical protein Plhal304r1_c006g0025261 [Plasmopara halstedii]
MIYIDQNWLRSKVYPKMARTPVAPCHEHEQDDSLRFKLCNYICLELNTAKGNGWGVIDDRHFPLLLGTI